MDQTSAAVPSANVKAINKGTGASFTFTTSTNGNYLIPQLPPGVYSLEASAAGFRGYVQDGITLQVNQSARIDIVLTVGQVSDRVEVTAEAPLLEAATAAMGEVVDHAKVQSLPLNGRNPLTLLELTPGASVGSQFGTAPGEQNFIVQGNFRLNGGQDLTNEVLIDGVPVDAASYGQPGFIPSLDAVQEFKVQTFPLSAEFGHTGGGVVNITTRAGTNQYHGSLFYFQRNDAVAARNFFSQTKPPKLIRNDQGGTFGGPIVRNKTFLFIQFEPFRQRYGLPNYLNVPTAAERAGDFSQTADAQMRKITIYDPQTTRPVAGGYTRDPFPNNVIPGNRIEPNALKILSLVPLPNVRGVNGSDSQNYLPGASGKVDQNQLNGRIDHQFTDTKKLSGRAGYSSINDEYPNMLGSIADNSRGRYPEARNVMLDFNDVLSPTLLVDIRGGFSRQNSTRRSPGAYQGGPAKIGFPSSIPDTLFPSINYGMGAIGSPNDNGSEIGDNYSLQGNLTKISSRHQFKAGADFRVQQFNWYRPGFVSGALTFSTAFTQGPDPFRPSPTVGSGLATMLLGMVTSSDITNAAGMAYTAKYLAGYVQDDFRITRSLTLNLGIRYDLISPFTERYNQVVNFDRTAINPLTGTPGKLRFPGRDGTPRGARDWDRNNWGPRVGFAWNFAPRSVVRGGYGIFYTQASWNGGGYDRAATSGFFARQQLSILDAVTPLPWGLGNPYPSGPPPIPTIDQAQQYVLGQYVLFIDRSDRTPYMQLWNFSLQRELVSGLLLDAAYAGSKGTHLQGPISYPLNQLPYSALSLGNALFDRVANPFAGNIAGPLGDPTITRQQLLRPYPQYTGVFVNLPQMGSSTYHSLQMRVEKRFSSGLTLLGSYTFSKAILGSAGGHYGASSVTVQNVYNAAAEKSLDPNDMTHSAAINYTYELPIGYGKPFLTGAHGVLGKVVSGWSISGITIIHSGRPFAISNTPSTSFSLGGTQRPNRVAGVSPDPTAAQVANRIFINGAAFSAPARFTYGNVSATEPHTRNPGFHNWDLTLAKETRITERVRLTFRADAFNVFNNVNFGGGVYDAGTNSSFGSGTFGLALSARDARILQFGLKINF